MAKKPLLKHALPDGSIATRESERPYTHVLLRKHDIEAIVAEVERTQHERLDAADRHAREHYNEERAIRAAGVGGRVLRHGRFGVTVTDFAFEHAVKFLEEHPSGDQYVAQARLARMENDAAHIEHVRKRYSPEWTVVSWHSRAQLAKPAYQLAGDQFRVEAINQGVRS